ncbi:MAG TPA: geranylgeranyl reductase family protein [Acidimicrobiales bacterium]
MEATGTGRSARPEAHHCDVLVIGGGPSGSACAYWLASEGHEVVLVERKQYPREKTCGDGLTPRSVKQLEDMGLSEELAGTGHRFSGLRSHGFGRTLELEWPDHPTLPSYGYVITRKDLDALVAERAAKAGATVWDGTEALHPVVEGGLVRGAYVKQKNAPDGHSNNGSTGTTLEVRARYTVVADGANSRFGRSLGTSRDRGYPLGMAIRGYWYSPRHDEPWIDSWLDIRDANGNVLPGYGWIFPVGDGRINVGIGLLSTFNQWKAVNTTHLLQSFCEYAPSSWGIRPETACGVPTGGRLPMGMSVGPHTGPTWLVIGDAGGTINPFNGEGIAYAYESGRYAADAVHMAISSGDGLALHTYEERLQAEFALYYKVARAFVKVIGRPELMRALVTTGMRSRTLMEWALRIMANLLRPDEMGPAEAAYKALATLARVIPG